MIDGRGYCAACAECGVSVPQGERQPVEPDGKCAKCGEPPVREVARGDIVRYPSVTCGRPRKACGRVLDVAGDWLIVEGASPMDGMAMAVRVHKTRATVDVDMMRRVKRWRRRVAK